MTLFGIDASDFDADRGPMDMLAMARDGISFVTHKLTEGTSTKHQNGGRVLAAARDAGIPFLGGYMVPRTPGSSIAAQVDYFLEWANKICPWWREFPGWFWQMDTEFWAYDHVAANVGHQAAQLIETLTGRRVLHYAPQWAYGNSVPAGEPLWASGYVAGSGPYRTLYPGDGDYRWRVYSGRTPDILQYTSSATIGTQPGCDANAFRGSADDFAALIGMGTASMTENDRTSTMGDRWGSAIAQQQDGVAVLLGDGSTVVVPNLLKQRLRTIADDLAAIKATLAAPLDPAAVASLVTAALIASGTNPLTDADHAGVRADVETALTDYLQRMAAAVAGSK